MQERDADGDLPAPGSRHPSTARPSSATLATSRGHCSPPRGAPANLPPSSYPGALGHPSGLRLPQRRPGPAAPSPGGEHGRVLVCQDSEGWAGSKRLAALRGQGTSSHGARRPGTHVCAVSQVHDCIHALGLRALRPPQAARQPGAVVPAPSQPSLSSPPFPSWPRRARGARAPPVKVQRGRAGLPPPPPPVPPVPCYSRSVCPAADCPGTRPQLPRVSSGLRAPTSGRPGPWRRGPCPSSRSARSWLQPRSLRRPPAEDCSVGRTQSVR